MDTGVIEGIDFSETMVEIAKKENKIHIKNGKVKIQLGDFDNVHVEGNTCPFTLRWA